MHVCTYFTYLTYEMEHFPHAGRDGIGLADELHDALRTLRCRVRENFESGASFLHNILYIIKNKRILSKKNTFHYHSALCDICNVP